MSLTVPIPEETVVVVQPAQTATINGQITINRIVDMPSEKKVIVFTKELGKIDLLSLSDDNYDNPDEWTNADIISAIQDYVNSLE